MLLGGRSSPMLLVVQLAQEHTPLQLSWLMRSGLGFGLAFFKGCQGLVAQLQVVLLSQSSFHPKHVRAWSISMQH